MIGFTTVTPASGMDERLARHLQNLDGFTSKKKYWQVVHRQSYSMKKEAHAREQEVKGRKSLSE